MGTQYFVANISKRQYFDPDHLGSENTKRSGILWGLSGHALAQLLLPDCDLDFHLESWIGDALVLVGDDADPNNIEQLKQFQETPDQDAYHIVTEQFDNITLNLTANLCNSYLTVKYLLEQADQHYFVFVNLAHTIMYLGAPHIEEHFIGRFGSDWRNRYVATLKSEPWHYPLPMTPEIKNKRGPHVVRAIDVIRQIDPEWLVNRSPDNNRLNRS